MNTTTTTKTPKTPNACLCGCGNSTGGRYAPGHDARHVSRLVEMAASGMLGIDTAHDELTSDALVAKFDRALAKAQAKGEPQKGKATTPKAKAPEAQPLARRAKVGRWEREGTLDGSTFTYLAKDGQVVSTDKFTLVS